VAESDEQAGEVYNNIRGSTAASDIAPPAGLADLQPMDATLPARPGAR
jgi:hypothetical protein